MGNRVIRGGLLIRSLAALIAGEDRTSNWLGTVKAACTPFSVLPDKGDVVLGGGVGLVNDYLSSVIVTNVDATDTQVLLKDGTTTVASGTTSGTPTTTSVPTNITATALDSLKGYFAVITVGGVAVARRITGNTNGASTVLTVDAFPSAPAAAVAVTVHHMQPILPAGVAAGSRVIAVDAKCLGAGWRIFTGASAYVTAVGRFQ